MIYMASPFSSEYPVIQDYRFTIACRAAGRLLGKGHFIYSPIAHTYAIAKECSLPMVLDFWHAFDRHTISVCKELWVLTIDGWRESKGVTAEIAIAHEFGIPVKYIDEQGNEVQV